MNDISSASATSTSCMGRRLSVSVSNLTDYPSNVSKGLGTRDCNVNDLALCLSTKTSPVDIVASVLQISHRLGGYASLQIFQLECD